MARGRKPTANFSLHDLEKRVQERARASAQVSYTRRLLDQGVGHCAKKLGEEAIETVLAAVEEDRPRLIAEAADLIYHLLVVLASRGITLAEGGGTPRRAHAAAGLDREGAAQARLTGTMGQRPEAGLSPYGIFSRTEGAEKRADTPMTLKSDEVTRLRSLHDRLDMAEVEEI